MKIIKQENRFSYFQIQFIFQVIKETGFLTGLYDENELVYENIKDKNDKIEFLQKCIDTVSKYTYSICFP